MTRMTRTGQSPLGWALLLGGWVLAGCGPEATGPEAGRVALARAPGGGKATVTVTAADPDTVPIDTTLTVRITGSGFAAGATVEYLLDSKLSTEVTATDVEFVSSTELRTTTAVTGRATLGTYDIAVTLVGGKRGVGAEKFEVVVKPVLLPEPKGWTSNAYDVNDDGVIVGMLDDGPNFHAARWVPEGKGWKVENLGLGVARAVNNAGEILVSRPPVGGGFFRARVFLVDGNEVEIGEGASGADMSEDGTVVGFLDNGTLDGGVRVLWPRRGRTWDAPIALPPMPGYAYVKVSGISDNGRWISGLVNNATGFSRAVVWIWDGSVVSPPRFVEADPALPSNVSAVSSTGAIAGSVAACGTCRSQYAYWPAAGAGSVPAPGFFHDINGLGQMVGSGAVLLGSKNGRTVFKTNRPVLWTLGASEVIDVGTFRPMRDAVAQAINSTGRVAVGREQDHDYDTHAVVWILP